MSEEKINYKKQVIKLALLVEKANEAGAATALEILTLNFKILEINLQADLLIQQTRIASALEKLIGDKEAAGKAEKVKQGLLERRKKKEVKPMK